MIERSGGVRAGNDPARQHYIRTVPPPARARTQAAVLLAAIALVVVRLPSLVQPMGADQGLYAYIGDRILRGELPYVDAWDQKPPAVHYAYALMRAVWPGEPVVPAVDLAAAAGIGTLLFFVGRAVASRGVGAAAALLFLFLSNPAFTRLNGVRVRAQCETFIALAVTAAALALVRRPRPGWSGDVVSGLLLGAAFTFKYNAAVYTAVALAAIVMTDTAARSRAPAVLVGACLVPAMFLAVFAGALTPLYEATIEYNLRYSGQTYTGPLHFISYLLSFPIAHARDDALWTIGGAGCVVLLLTSRSHRERLIPVLWVAAACLSIAINGSRGLPQYFVQGAPALALAAAWGGDVGRTALKRMPSATASRAILAASILLVTTGIWRVNQFPKLLEQTSFDASHAFGWISREAYLERYADERKYSALDTLRLGRFMSEHSAPDSRVYVFGFAGASYVYADRAAASRFFWSRPIIAGFRNGQPGYGSSGVLAELERNRPAIVALQRHDWAPDVDDSAHFFMSTPPLADWLQSGYRPVIGLEGFDVWLRRD
jgi:hypothetical protein